MNTEAKADLAELLHRIRNTPADFLRRPRSFSVPHGKTGERTAFGEIATGAVVSDLLNALGGPLLTAAEAAAFEMEFVPVIENRLRIALIACHLLHLPYFREQKRFASMARNFLVDGLHELSAHVDADQILTDAERAEELARRALAALDLRPAGETLTQARDRLTTVDSVERARVVAETRRAQEHAQAVREALARQAAEEAASKMSRE